MPKRSLAIFIPKIGIYSEVWAQRQAKSFDRFDGTFLAWEAEIPQRWRPENEPIIISKPWSFNRLVASLLNRFPLLQKLIDRLETRSITAALNSKHFDAAICHFGWTSARAHSALAKTNIPYLTILHGLDLSDSQLFTKEGKATEYFKKLIESLVNSDGIIVVGSHMKELLAKHVPEIPPEKYHCIPCGAPVDQFRTNRIADRTDDEPLRIVSVGRLFEGKGISDSIRAISIARKNGARIEFSIVGEGAQRNELEQLVERLELQSAITFCGSLNPEQVRESLSKHHLFLQPSKKAPNGWVEGFGVSITEAMAAGLPVIATRSGGIPDQVRHEADGVLVEEGDVSSIAKNIERLYRDESLRRSMAASARERAEQFDSQKLARELQAILIESCD